MKFIPSLKIGSQILTLIQAFITGSNARQDFSALASVGISPFLTDDLQPKDYTSGKFARALSLSMDHHPEAKSIETAYKTDQNTNTERTKKIDFVNKPEAAKAVTQTRTVFERVTAQQYANRKKLNVFQLDRISQCFTNTFKAASFKRTAEHILCNNLLPFADVMINSGYVIRIKKSRTDSDAILSKLEEIDYSGSLTYKIELLTTDTEFHFIEIIPQEAFGLQKLINDYTSFTNRILNSDIHKVLKSRR